jgi:hypothetical protein
MKECDTHSPFLKVKNVIGRIWNGFVKFGYFCVVAGREMGFAFWAAYRKYYSQGSLEKIIDNVSINKGKIPLGITCAICDRKFKESDAVVRCSAEDCGEIYHYTCWHFNHGCCRPDCLSNTDGTRNITLH